MAVINQVLNARYALYNGDSCEVLPTLPGGSVHLSIYSPPFCGLYHYSSSERDLSNSRSYEEFFEHYDFIIRELHRVTMPGRLSAVHCMDIPSGNTGCDRQRDFPGDIIRQHTHCQSAKCTDHPMRRAHGECGHGLWEWVCRYAVWKEPLAVRNRTMAKNLAHQTIVKDASRCSNASADTVLMFRKKGTNPVPIEHPIGLLDYAGSRAMPADLLPYRGWSGKQTENLYSHWIWRQYASSFWDDVRIDRVLPFKQSKAEEDEKHVHPLQLDVITRIVVLWSNPGEVVLTPFAGVGSEIAGALDAGRNGVAIELKPSYFAQMTRNVEWVATSGLASMVGDTEPMSLIGLTM